MEQEIIVETTSSKNYMREIEITFPVYIKRNYPKSKSIRYTRYVNDENYFEISLPKDTSHKYVQFFYGIEFNNHMLNEYYTHPYQSSYKECVTFSTPEEFEMALKRYQEEFLNKI